MASHNKSASAPVPPTRLAQRTEELVEEGSLGIHGAGGYRSSIGARLLRKNGVLNVVDLIGGITAWKKHQETAA